MEFKKEIMDEQAIERAITRICYEIIEKNRGVSDLCIVGIYTRGIVLAERIAKKIFEFEGIKVPCGGLDVTMFRDDIKEKNIKVTQKTSIDFDIKDKKIILVDDVLYSGRTVRAGIDALMNIARPKSVALAVLIDRGHREIPIRPDYVGKNVPTSREEQVKVLFKDTDGEEKVVIF